MSFLLTFLIAFATTVALVMVSVRKFFLTSDSAGIVFVAINWALLIVATAIFALFVKWIESYVVGGM